MKTGEILAYYEGQYSKVKITRIREHEELNTINDEYEVKTFIDFKYIGQYKKGEFNSESFDTFIKMSKQLDRKTHCWKCNHDLDEQVNDICDSCGWMICYSDGACGCLYRQAIKNNFEIF